MPDELVPGGQTPPAAPDPTPAGGQTPPAAPSVPAASPPTPPAAQPSQPAQPAAPATPQNAPAADDDPVIKLSEARRLRQEAEANRKLIEQLQAQTKKYEDEKLTADQRLQRDLAESQRKSLELERQNQELRIRSAVEVHALRMGFHDPSDAASFLRYADLVFDSAGNPTNVDKLLTTLKAEKSYLVKAEPPATPPAPAPPASPAPQAPQAPRPPAPAVPPANPARSDGGAKLTLAQAKEMAIQANKSGDYKEYQTHQVEIRELLAEEARKGRQG